MSALSNLKAINGKVLKKSAFFGSLYLAQTLPKGYLKFMPILMAERGSSMLTIGLVSLLSIADWTKPFLGFIFDQKQFSSMSTRKNIVVTIQITIITIFLMSSTLQKPELQSIAAILSFCNFLTSVHDTAVDGLAVQLLRSTDEQNVGGLGQYLGYKLGSLLTGGILPAIFGTKHRYLCLGTSAIMSVLMLFTISFKIPNSEEDIPIVSSNHTLSSLPLERSLKDTFLSIEGLVTVLTLLTYKFGDHGLDFIWTPLLSKFLFDRKTIVKTQFVVGTIASVIGAAFGGFLCTYFNNVSTALAVTGICRVFPNIMQLLFSKYQVLRSVSYLSIHSLLENIVGSAVTGCMFSYLLRKSSMQKSALSYAILNTIALVGMTLGELTLSLVSHFFSFDAACSLAIAVNISFSVLVFHLSKMSSNKDIENKNI